MKTDIRDVPFVNLKAQTDQIRSNLQAAFDKVIENSSFILGHDVKYFEIEFADYCNTQYAVGVASGTAALEAALRAFDIGPGDEVITAVNTFVATAFAITYTGATPVFVDINPKTYNIDVNKIEEAITERTKAIVPVHLYGQPAQMDKIMTIAKQHNLIVVEDACQAHGALYKGQKVGSFGDASAFSFYPAKNLGAFGDGGMVVTNNKKAADTMKVFRNVGQRIKNTHDVIGNNYRLDTLQAVVLRLKLPFLDSWNAARQQKAEIYEALLCELDEVFCPQLLPDMEHVWHLYVARVSHRDELRDFLRERRVATGIHYPLPIHLQPAFASLGYGYGDFPIAEKYAREIISLPMFPELSEGDIQYVVECMRDFININRKTLIAG